MNDRGYLSALLIASAFISTSCVTVFAQPPSDAPALNLTVTTSLYEAVRFLFEAEPLVQRDLVPGTIVPMRVSLVRGIVLGPDDQPRTGVRIEVHGHPEYGSTLTRDGGRYDLVVNGGDPLVLTFTEPGRMSAHRRWTPPWNEAQDLAPVKLLGVDGAATVIDFTDPIQVHRATVVDDEDGTRQAALMFRQGTVATMVMPDESTEEIDRLTVRATEFTVGGNGPASMPAELPTGTQYTYAIEFTADEAEAAGARTVELNPPATLYVENFLEVPVGTVVPVGSYSRTDARWGTEPNGRVVGILALSGGAAELDLEGEGVAATSAELAEAGIIQAERETLADLYPIGEQLTRMPVLHFTQPLDCNFAGRPPDDATEPPEDGPEENQEEDEHCEREGSIIECENQILGQRIEIPGTPFSLNYRTSRVPGGPSRHLHIPIAGNSISASLLRARLDVTVAERTFTSTFDDVDPGQSHDFGWDGLDAYGRAVQGAQPARVCVTYDYPASYAGTDRAIDEEIFGDWSQDGVAVAGRNNSEVGLSRCYSRGPYAGAANIGTINKSNMIRLGGLDARTSAAGLGGWTLSVHHTLGLETGTLYLGTGEKRDLGDSRRPVAVRVAGNGTVSGNATGSSAVGAAVANPQSVAVGGDGSIYIGSSGLVRRVTLDGALEAVAGTVHPLTGQPQPGFAGDGGAATSAQVSNQIVALDVGPDGSVYIADAGNRVIRRVSPDGIITTIAGNGSTFPVDAGMINGQGPALAVTLPCLADIELTNEGSLWMANACGTTGDQRIRRLSGDTIYHVAGFPYPSWLDAANDRPRVFVGPPNPPHHIFGWDGGSDGSISGDSTPRGGSFAGKWALWRQPHSFAESGHVMYVAEGSGATDGVFRRIRKLPRSGGGISTYRREFSISPNDQGVFPCTSIGCSWTIQEDGISSTVDDIGLLPGRGITFLTFFDGAWRVRLAPAEPGSDIVDLMGGGTDLLVDEDLVTPALNLRIQQIVNRGMDIGPDGSIYVNDQGGHKVVKLANGAPGMYGAATIPSEDGSELYEFDERGRHLRTLNGLTNDVVWSFAYDAQGRLIGVADAYGDTTTIVRNPAGEPTALRSPDGIVTTLGLDEHGYVDQIVYPTGAVYGFVNRDDGIMTSMTRPRQLVHEFSYDSLGRLERDEDPEDGSQRLVRTAINDDEYQVEHQTALGRTTTYRVSRSVASERTRTQRHPDGSTSTQAELANEITRTTNPDGTVIETRSGPDPRLGHLASVPERTTVTTPSGLAGVLTTAVSFMPADGENPLAADEVIREVAVQQDLNRTHTVRYRAAEGATPAEVLRRSPENRAVLAVLGLHGRVDRVRLGTWSDGAFSASTFHDLVFGYDPRGRLTTVTQGSDASARTMTYHYDENGFVDQVTDPASQTHEFDYDDAGRPTTVTLPGGQIMGLAYDADGNLSGVTSPGQPQHTLVHNGVDDLERHTPPDVLPGEDATQYTYDDDHALTDILRPDGRSLRFEYDDAGRLDSVLTDRRNIELAYWPTTGQFRSFTEANGGTTEYRRDGPLLVGVQRTGSFAGEVTWSHGADFSLQSETVAGASTASYDYDHDDLLTRAGAQTITRHVVSGAVSGTALDEVSSTITYSDFGEPASLAYFHGATPLYAAIYQRRDALGRIESKMETIDGVSVQEEYSYDATGRLDRVERDGVEAFDAEYDGNGNRIELQTPSGTRVASHDDQDRLLADGALQFTYTEVGDLRTRTDTSTNQVTTYEYDELGALIEVELPGGTEIEYTVDGAGRRIGKRVEGALDRGWLYGAQIGPVAELDALGAIRSRFVYGTRAHVPDYMERGGETFRLVTDHLGSVRLVVNTETGAIAQRIDYDPWGVVTQDTNPGFQPFGYAGGLYDPDTGLVRFGARDYDAWTGRWTSKDPIGFDGGDTNLYAYVGGDPVNFIDDTGLGRTQRKTAEEARDAVNADPRSQTQEGLCYICRNPNGRGWIFTPIEWGPVDNPATPNPEHLKWDPSKPPQNLKCRSTFHSHPPGANPRPSDVDLEEWAPGMWRAYRMRRHFIQGGDGSFWKVYRWFKYWPDSRLN